MVDRFTKRALKAIESAVLHAQSNSNANVEPVHLLRALLDSPQLGSFIATNGAAAASGDEATARLSAAVSGAIGSLPRVQSSARPTFSPALSHVVSGATSRASASAGAGTDQVPTGTLHFLLALLACSATAGLFQQAGVNVPELLSKAEKLVTSSKGRSSCSDIEDFLSAKGGGGSAIERFATEMVSRARQNKYDPVIGREDEMRQVVEVLAKKGKSNVILVGPAGVGKTAIVTGIAQSIARNELKPLSGSKIYNVDVGAMVAGAAYRGDFEQRLKELVSEATDNPQIILFIDEIHVVLGAGKAGEGALDAANILKPGLADGSLKVIGATTYDEYRRYVKEDPAFERRFTRIDVREPSIEDTVTVLRGLRSRLEAHHGVRIADRALVCAAELGKRYVPGRRLPDLAIDIIDTACSSAVISLHAEPPEIAALRAKVWRLELERTSIEMDLQRVSEADPGPSPAGGPAAAAPGEHGSGSAGAEPASAVSAARLREALAAVVRKIEDAEAELQDRLKECEKEKKHVVLARELRQKIEEAKGRAEQAQQDGNRYLVWDLQTNVIPVYEKQLAECSTQVETIGPEHVAQIISRWTGIPASRVSIKEGERLLQMGSRLRQKVFGQDEAVEAVTKAILASRAGLVPSERPVASFMFVGPTGVGKTELAKALSAELNGSTDSLVVIDMSDYSNEISLTKLIGAPAGYVGYNAGGALTEPIKERPYSVVLLDEIDLAHQSVLNVLYQLLDEGRVVDGRGERVSFRNTVVIMTTNLGSEFIRLDASSVSSSDSACGSVVSNVDFNGIERRLVERFGAPLINRIDKVVCFNHLSVEALESIVASEIASLNARLAARNVRLVVSQEMMRDIAARGLGSPYGARMLRRTVSGAFYGLLSAIVLGHSGETPIEVRCWSVRERSDGGSLATEGALAGEFMYVVDTQPATPRAA